MKLRWLTIALRLAGLILILGAAVIFFRDSLSFRSETQTSGDAYEIHHTVVLSQSVIISGVAGVVLFGSSLLIRRKRI